MAEPADYALLRADVGETETTLPDLEAEAIFARAATEFGSAGTYAGARVLVFRKQWAEASEKADYTQNEESERLGQIADAKRALLTYWEGLLAKATAAAELPKGRRPAFFGLAKASAKRWYP